MAKPYLSGTLWAMGFKRYFQKGWSILHQEGWRSLARSVRNVVRRPLYHLWWRKQRPSKKAIHFEYTPTISLIVPVYNPKGKFLKQMMDSVLNQYYPHLELCLCDDASPKPHVRNILQEYEAKDPRVKVVFHEKNQNISGASNSALELATGDYVALLDHDDLLAPDALFEVTKRLQGSSKTRPLILYSDEDKIGRFGLHNTPFFKPDWSPELLLSIMYTGHLTVYDRTLVNQVRGFRKGYEGSQDHDLALRMTEQTDRIVHIPKILYHWRQHAESTAGGIGVKSYAMEAAKKALDDALKRRHQTVTIKDGLWPGSYRSQFEVKKPLISIIIPFRDQVSLLKQCLKSLHKSTYSHYEILLVDNESQAPETHAFLESVKEARVIAYPYPFNFSKINNFAAKEARGEFLVFLNNDTEVIEPGWLEAMLEHAQHPKIAAVGAKLLYPNNTVQHAGVVMGIAGTCSHAFRHVSESLHGYMGLKDVVRNVSAVTAACLMMSKTIFEKLNGFDEDYEIAYQDVDLCLRALEKGYRNVYTPYAVLTHYESVTRKHAFAPHETKRLQKQWKSFIEQDPYYSPHLTRTREDFRILS